MHPNIIGTGRRAASTATITSNPSTLYSLTVVEGATGNTLNITDSTGTITYFQHKQAVLGTAGDSTKHYIFPGGISCPGGIRMVMTGNVYGSITFK